MVLLFSGKSKISKSVIWTLFLSLQVFYTRQGPDYIMLPSPSPITCYTHGSFWGFFLSVEKMDLVPIFGYFIPNSMQMERNSQDKHQFGENCMTLQKILMGPVRGPCYNPDFNQAQFTGNYMLKVITLKELVSQSSLNKLLFNILSFLHEVSVW